MIRRKYKKEEQELASSLLDIDRKTAILEVKLVGLSKIKNNLLYECKYIDNGTIKKVPIIAYDVTQALAKLDPYVNSAIPENILKIMLGNERYNM
jgi:hypothetical protein|tara:strand:+ start:208 stop:492 length:285 start_codon:yes stop_codon:yes gene_type:complete